MTFRVHGFIIGKNDVREYDRAFTLYTKEHGKVSVMTIGVRKITSKLCGNLELFSEVALGLARGRSLDRIAHVEMIDRHLSIKEQLEKSSVLYYFFEIFNHLIKDGQRDDDLYALVVDFFSSLHDVPSGKAGLAGCAALLKLGMALGCQERSNGIIQTLQRSQSILTFVKNRSNQERNDLLGYTERFVRNQCDIQPQSKAYFDFYTAISTKYGKNAV